MASTSPSTQAPPAAPPSAPGAAAPNVSDSSRAGQEQSSASAGGIGRRIRLATTLPRKLGRVALRLVLGRGKKTTDQQQYGGLKDVVSYSSRRMAAGRALEYELGREGGALFLDPLAAALAGPAAIEDSRKWADACSTAANAISDALAAGRRAPSKQELIDLISSSEGDKKGKKGKKGKSAAGGSNFTIGAPLTLVALAARSIHRGRVEGSHSAAVPLCPAENSISLVTARHRWFDAGILESLAGEGYGVEVKLVVAGAAAGEAENARAKSASVSGSAAAGTGKGPNHPVLRVEISPRGRRQAKEAEEKGPVPPIRQVVLLGSGMDARAWRLPLGGGGSGDNDEEESAVAWFDLDSGPVCEIKRAELEGAGAELVKSEGGGGGDGEEKEKQSRPRFPLKAASYALVGCDMASEEWVDKLKEAGFDPSRPALFAAEGLIYYLGSKAPAFMRSLQSIAARGSVLLLDALDEPGVASAVKKAEGKGLQGQFSFGVPADLGDLARFFAGFGFDRLVAADTWTVLRQRFQREAPGRCFTKDKPTSGRVEGGIRFIAVAKGV